MAERMADLGEVGAAVAIADFTADYQDTQIDLPEDLQRLQDEIVEKIQKSGGKAYNGRNLSLQNWQPMGVQNDRYHFSYHPSTYFKLLATHKSLDEAVGSSDQTVRMRYGGLETMVNPFDYSRSPYSKAVGLSGAVVTCDRKIVLVQRSANVAVEPNSWHVSVAEGMKATDLDERGQISPIATVNRAIREELQDTRANAQKLKIDNIRIMGLGVSRKYLQPQFLMRIDTPMTAQKIIEDAENSRGTWERSNMRAIDLDPNQIFDMLRQEQWSPHGEMALLALLRDEGYIR